MGNFLHGIETVEVASASGVTITQKTAVIALLGTSSKGDVNSVKLCTSAKDDEQFDTTTTAGTIYQSLVAIRKQYAQAIVFVVNMKATDTLAEGDMEASIALLDSIKSNYGYAPKIFIAPGYSNDAEHITLLLGYADKYRGIAILDCPADMTLATALTSRGTSGIWNTANYRAQLAFPKIVNISGVAEYYSAYAAGLRAKVDNEEGYWVSTSNHAVNGIKNLAIDLSWILNSTSCDVNMLNAQGITTLVNEYGKGWKEWGNRSAAFPVNSDVRTFICQQRLDDITSEAIEQAALQYIDKPMTKTAIDAITEMVNNYFNQLIGDGALCPGSKCSFDDNQNTATEMAAGHFVWTKTFCGTVPGEHFTFYSVIDTTLLTNNL